MLLYSMTPVGRSMETDGIMKSSHATGVRVGVGQQSGSSRSAVKRRDEEEQTARASCAMYAQAQNCCRYIDLRSLSPAVRGPEPIATSPSLSCSDIWSTRDLRTVSASWLTLAHGFGPVDGSLKHFLGKRER